MSLIEIQTPLLDGGIRWVNFFNGRLLSGEDLSAEQTANRNEHERLGMAIGQGIVTGLEVLRPAPPPPGATVNLQPKVTVKKGLAVNSLGQTLQLFDTIDVVLVHGSTSSTGTAQQATFRDMQQAPISNYMMGEGAYLLTIAPASGSDGLSPVSGFSNVGSGGTVAACNTRYRVDAVQFFLYPLTTVSSAAFSDANHLRNTIAYACFGYPDPNVQPKAFGPLVQRQRLLDTLPFNLTADAPLAILYWTSTGDLRFIDTWSVRRSMVRSAFTDRWNAVMDDRRLAEAEAMFLQFQSQIADLQLGVEVTLRDTTSAQSAQAATNKLNTITAEQILSYLPAAGYLPVGNNQFDWKTFLGPLAPPAITCVDGAFLRLILHNSFHEEPIKVGPYANGVPSGELPVDVYQDPSQPDFVLFARSNIGRVLVTVNAQGYQPANVFVSFTVGQQTQLTIPLKQDSSLAQQRPLYIDVDEIKRPALRKIRFSIVEKPEKFTEALKAKMIKADPLPKNVSDWLSSWQTWFNDQYPNQGINCCTPAIYINDYFSPPKIGGVSGDPLKTRDVPEDPLAYAVFGDFAVPLTISISYYRNPLPVLLAKAGILGLTDDVIHALAGIGMLYVDQVAGAWAKLLANATAQSIEYSKYLIGDALRAVENINAKLLYYEGIDALVDDTPVEEILEQMAIRDDVALANADQEELGENLESIGFANRLITQARKAVPPEHWSLESLGVKTEQIPSLQQIGISSKGELAHRAETNEGHKQLESVLQLDPQAIDQLHTKAYQQITTSSLALLREKDLLLLPNVDAEVATQLAAANITTLDQITKTDKAKLMEVANLSEDAAEDLQEEAENAKKESLEATKLASITKAVADALDKLGVKTISHLIEKGEEGVVEAFKAIHGDRAVHFVSALFDGIAGAGR